jgi:uncharacterized LabA/DUF88 family protein
MQTTILWDIENVTPKNDSGFVQNLIDFIAESGGQISSALSFGDWTNSRIKKLSSVLAENNFELIHIPRSRKNSADISLITHATEMVFIYPHLERFVLVTGDADFRPLIQTLKKNGKETWVVCDAQNASEDLLSLADKYFDYRSIIQSETEYEEDSYSENGSSVAMTRDNAFDLFQEAVALMEKQGKQPSSGSVKVKMKLLNEDFDENELGFKRWKDFIREAVKHTDVSFTEGKDIGFTTGRTGKTRPGKVGKIFSMLLDSINGDRGWVPFTHVSQNMINKKIDIRKYGYSKFKKLALDAEKRGLIETKNEGLQWYLKSS